MLNSVLSLMVVLVLTNNSREVKGEILIDDMVDHVSEGFLGVKEAKLL